MSTLRVEALEQPDGTAFVFNNKNLLINGGMNIWQRSTSTSVSTDTFSTVDRWKTRVSGMGTFTISRSTDVPSAQGFGYSTKWDCTTADASPAASDFIILEQKIEGQNIQHLLKGTSSAKAITLSFWVKSNKTGTYIASLYDGDNTRRISKSYTISSASTWEKKEITFDGDTTGVLDNDNGASLWVQWWLGAGSNFTSGTLATSWEANTDANVCPGQTNLADSTSNELYITGCQLEVGSTASGFEFEPYATTLTKCMRYNYRIQSVSGGNFVCCGIGTTNSSGTGFHVVPQLHPLRATPTMSYSALSDFDMEYRDTAPTSISLFGTNSNGQNICLQVLQGATGSGECTMLMLDQAGWINFDAEL